jgi:tetratricopeptide (TPR) repeat protein
MSDKPQSGKPKTRATLNKPKTPARRPWRLNLRALSILGITLVLVVAGFFGVRMLRAGLGGAKLLRQARELAHAKPQPRYDLAGSFLNEYLNINPNDPEALDLKAEILADTARSPEHLKAAMDVGDRVLRLDPRRSETRRRQVKLHLRMAQLAGLEPAHLQTAHVLATEMVRDSDAEADEALKTLEGGPPSAKGDSLKVELARNKLKSLQRLNDDPAAIRAARGEVVTLLGQGQKASEVLLKNGEAHRLAAQVLEGLVFQGERKALEGVPETQAKPGKPVSETDAFQDRLGAIGHYKAALKLDPKDIASTRALAGLYVNYKKDRVGADRVYEDLRKAHPSAETHLACYAYYLTTDPDDKKGLAAKEMAQAVALKPHDRDVLLAAAEDAVRRNAVQRTGDEPVESPVAAARRYLDAIPMEHQSDPQVRLVRGIVELHENNIDGSNGALESWRKGLEANGGTDLNLTGRLAFVLLNLGRVDEAKPLIEQYRRLSGGSEPSLTCRYLNALKDLKENHPVRTILELKGLQIKVLPKELEAQVAQTLGQAYEAIRNETEALEAYTKASSLAASSEWARLAKIRLLEAIRPEEAEQELRRALSKSPNEPRFLIALARIEFQKQLRRPRPQRNWKSLEQSLEDARKVAPDDAGLALIQADYQSQIGRLEDAAKMLGEAVKQGRGKKNAELWAAYANRLAMRGAADEALMVLERASSPAAVGDLAAIRIARAQLLTLQGHGEEARTALLKDIEKLTAAEQPLIWAALGDFYVAQKDFESARSAYLKWAELLPDDPKPWLFLLDRSLAEGGPEADQRIEDCIKSLQRIGGEHSLYSYVAQVQNLLRTPRGNTPEPLDARNRRFLSAETKIDQILRLAPKQRHGHLLKGQLAEAQARLAEIQAREAQDKGNAAELLQESTAQARAKIKEAIDAYERALEFDGGQTAFQKLVILYSREHDDAALERLSARRSDLAVASDRIAAEVAMTSWKASGSKKEEEAERAKKLAAKVVAADPDNLDTRVWQARLLLTVNDSKGAEATLRELAERKTSEPGPWLALMSWQVQRNDHKAAAATVERLKTVVKTAQPEFLWAQCCRKIGDLGHALEYYETALEKWPNDVLVARSAADFFEATGRADRAEATIRGVLKHDVNQQWATRALALLLSARGRQNPSAWEEARKLLDTPAVTSSPEDRLVRGIVLARSPDPNDRKAATEQLERLVNDVPRDFAISGIARRTLTERYMETGETAKARSQAQIDARDNGNPAAIAVYVESLIRERLWDQADQQVTRLEALDNGQPYVVRLRARVLKGQDKIGDAVATLEKFFNDHKEKPTGPIVGKEAVAGLIDLGADEAAVKLATTLKDRWPQTAWMLATLLAKQGQTSGVNKDDALIKQAFDLNALAASNGSREAVENAVSLGLANRDNKGIERAGAVIDAALQRTPNDPDLLSKKGFIFHFQQNYREEVRLYEQVLNSRNGPSDFKFLNNMAWTLCEGLGEPQKALEKINDAFREAGIFPQFLDTRGVIFTRLKRLDEAIKDLEKAALGAKGTASYASIEFHLARAYYLANRKDEARNALERARKAMLKVESLEPKEHTEFDELSANLLTVAKP